LEGNREILRTAERAAREAGSFLVSLRREGSDLEISQKGDFDYVTSADTKSEEIIKDIILSRFPSHSFLSEEGEFLEGEGDGIWVVDPLDGTTNYICSFPHYSVSVAFVRDRKVEVGVVFDPERDELFYAVSGSGAFMNGKAIRVNRVSDLSRSIILSGLSSSARGHLDLYLDCLRKMYTMSLGVRRSGSAALDLCYTAAGRADCFWEPRLKSWDISAGSLILTEAGGVVTDFNGGDDYIETGDVVGAPPGVHAVILDVIKKVFKDL
jgi:myo-inositol-1(or 4)-monophosphatase